MRLRFNNRRKRSLRGTSLIEALVAMGIFGTTFVSLYAGMSMGFAIIGNARENLRATQIMVEKVETIRLYSWDQINTTGFIPATFTESYLPPGTGSGVVASGGMAAVATEQSGSDGVDYNGGVTVAAGPTGLAYSGNMRRVNITLSWTSGGRTHNRSMSTYVTRNGLQNYTY